VLADVVDTGVHVAEAAREIDLEETANEVLLVRGEVPENDHG
jgi:hypothetical protein